jgi:hypothetical protein
MKIQVPAKKTDGGVGVRSHLHSFNHIPPTVVSDSSPNTDFQESALHTDKYNLTSILITAKPPGNNQRGITHALTSKVPIQKKVSLDEPHPKYKQKTDHISSFESKTENGTGLPNNLKASIETLSGMAMNDVRVHYNSSKPAMLQALAYTKGNDIHISPGQEKYLPHESWHVVQQKQGRVKSQFQTKGVAINAAKGLEREADEMGKRATHLSMNAQGSQGIRVNSSTIPWMEETKVGTVTSDTIRGTFAHTASLPVQTQRNSSIIPSGSVVQCASTMLRFSDRVNGNDKITATQHIRGGVHSFAKNWVLTNGAWNKIPPNAVCNHSRDYDEMAQAILLSIHDETLVDAVTTITGHYSTLEAKNQGVSVALAKHSKILNDIIATPGSDVNVDDVQDAFHYYLYKISDYPPNLFYWPNRTKTNPDEPKGEILKNGWVPRQKVTDTKRLQEEKKRLKKGRQDLTAI